MEHMFDSNTKVKPPQIGSVAVDFLCLFEIGFKNLRCTISTKKLMKLVLKKRIGHLVLRWNVDNICIRTDPAGNIKAGK